MDCNRPKPASSSFDLPAALRAAAQLHQRGDLRNAEAGYRRILDVEPHNASALHRLGLIRAHDAHFDEAEGFLIKALKSNPQAAEIHYDLARVLQTCGRHEESIRHFRDVLAIRPGLAEAHVDLGNALQAVGKQDEATACYRNAIAFKPAYAEAHNNLGNMLQAQRQFEEAIACYRQALAISPSYAEAHANLGNAVRALGRREDAIACYRKAGTLKPDLADAYYNRGNELREHDRHEEAAVCYETALAMRPAYAEAHNNLGNVLHELHRFEDAIAAFHRALAIRPGYAEARNNLGHTLSALDRNEEAIACYQDALALQPNNVEMLNNHAVALEALHRHQEAIACYERALAISPDHVETHWNESLARLTLGDFAIGWQKYEWRWRTKDYVPEIRSFACPLWLGESDLDGKSILLHAEQGLGDTLQFARYAPLVAARGGRVTLEVHAPLKNVLESLAGLDAVVVRGAPQPAFDWHCPLMSLPLAFRTTLGTVPARVPYLAAPADRLAHWQAVLGRLDRPRVGLAWSGNSKHKKDRNRSIALQRLETLVSMPGVRFVTLQTEVRPHDAELLAGFPDVVPLGDHLADFADTAAVVSQLDLVITVDTSVAHLAGALAKPVWLLLPYAPDWRWLLDREDSPWYPTMRLFRQSSAGDWDTVIGRVSDELHKWAGTPIA